MLPFKKLSFFFQTSRYNSINLSASSSFHAQQLITQKRPRPKDLPNFDAVTLGFGLNSTDHMAYVDFDNKNGWGKPHIVPLRKMPIHPFNSSLHYAVQCFEGMKAYKNLSGEIRMFRPQCNLQRFKDSSKRISLPDFDGNQLYQIIKEYVKLEVRWIPPISEFSLYLRPLHFSMENSLGVKTPRASRLMVLSSPVGPYYPSGFKPISLACSMSSIRSAPGGTGAFKVGGNYGPTLSLGNKANKKGHHQVLWLYQDQIIEVGASNIFFIFKAPNNKFEVVTPELKDLILPGITRDSIIRLLKTKSQYIMSERSITIHEVIEKQKNGDLLECFSAGTAVIIGSVKNIQYNGENYPIHIDEHLHAGEHTFSIRKELLDIQEGRKEDKFGWTRLIN